MTLRHNYFADMSNQDDNMCFIPETDDFNRINNKHLLVREQEKMVTYDDLYQMTIELQNFLKRTHRDGLNNTFISTKKSS